MIVNAWNYTDKLSSLFNSIVYDPKYMFFDAPVSSHYTPSSSTEYSHEFAFVDKNDEIYGYMKYNVDRYINGVNGISLIHFGNKNGYEFSKDVHTVFSNIFLKFKFNRVIFGVIVGNPAEKSYNRLVKRCGGSVIGIFHDDVRLINGNLADLKFYEVIAKNFKYKRSRNEK